MLSRPPVSTLAVLPGVVSSLFVIPHLGTPPAAPLPSREGECHHFRNPKELN